MTRQTRVRHFKPSSHCMPWFCVTSFSLGIFVDFYFALIPVLFMLAFFQCKCVLTSFLQTVNEVLIFSSCICSHFHSILRWSQMKKHYWHRRWATFSMCSLEKLLAASFSGEQGRRTEGKWIPTQRSVLPQEAHLPLLLVQQLETHSGSSTAWRNTQYKEWCRLCWSGTRWGALKDWNSTHIRTPSTKLRCLLCSVSSFFCTPCCHFLKDISGKIPMNLT